MSDENGPFENLVRTISEKAGTVLENTIRELALVSGTKAAITEDLEAIEAKAASDDVCRLARNVAATFRTMSERQEKKTMERLGLLDEGMTLAINTVRDLQRITADKSVLEFEIKLLERFIITSEVVRDWKEHVKRILVEINDVVKTYFLFSLFLLEDDTYDLEVFWRDSPAEGSRARFEAAIQREIRRMPGFENIQELQIIHNVARPENYLPDLGESSLALPSKTVFLDAPKIGGIVGVGVHFDTADNPIKALVIESVLTTLLNVVGSIKAIYKYTKELDYYATRDPLTNLFNQRVFWDLLDYEVVRADRHGYSFSVLMVDLDNFKVVNDTYGHALGDRFLREFAEVLRFSARREDIVARYGGDEFALILPEVSMEQTHLIAARLLENLADFSLSLDPERKIQATASIGAAVFPNHATGAKDLFLVADNMLYRAKSLGRNRLSIPSPEDVVEVFRQSGKKHAQLRRALEGQLLEPFFQPIADAFSGRVVACEVLMRLTFPGEIMEAGEFIGLAESTGLISKLDYIVMDKAFAKVMAARFRGNLFINLSPKALIIAEFIPTVRRLVGTHGVDPTRVVFEITERETVRNVTLLEKFVQDLKCEGFKFAIDDFGSGFSSFSYLKRFPVDYLKIDGDFIKGMVEPNGRLDRSIVASISTLAAGLGIKTVAEAVENEAIMAAVRQTGLNLVQGYHIGRPAPNLL